MGTVVNGNVWSGACVNGKVVSGLVKNGAVFYKKQLIDLYKRRVMVGDNLRNKVVYGDFKMGYYVTLMNADEEDSITCNNNRLDTVYEYITSDYCSVDNNMRDSSSNLSLYEYDATNGTEILNNNSLIKNDKDYIVSEIIDNATYRHLFIKDPNIRPLQVGDIVVSNTKFYFNVPDDFRSELPSTYTPGIKDIIILNKNDLVQKMRINYALNIYDRCSIEYMKKSSNGSSWSSRTDATIFDLKQEKNLSTVFAGDMDLLEASGFVGTVTEINTTSPAYKYIMVDTTTLGE